MTTLNEIKRMSRVRRCPFCGGGAALHESITLDPPQWYVSCQRCGIATYMRQTPEEVVEKWNRRAGK